MSAARHAGTPVATGLAIFASLLLFMAIAVRGGGRHAELEESQPRNVPAAFAEEAERTRIESAIRRAADTLDAARQQEGDLERVYTQAAAKAEAERNEAHGLEEQSKELATEAVKRRAEWQVELSKADTDEQTVQLNKKMASLMAFRSQSLKTHAEHRAKEAKELLERAEELRKRRQVLVQEAKKEGDEGSAIVTTAGSLLLSAKELSRQAQNQSRKSESDTTLSKMTRLQNAQTEAKKVMDEDLDRLARAKVKHKGLTRLEGVDELSRSLENIKQLDQKMTRELPPP